MGQQSNCSLTLSSAHRALSWSKLAQSSFRPTVWASYMTEPFSFPHHNEDARLRAEGRGTPGVYWLEVSSVSTGYKWETARFSAKVAVKVGWGWGASRVFHYMDLLDPLTISPSPIRGGSSGPQKNPKPVSRHSQGSVCKTTITKNIYKQEFCPAYNATAP